MNFSVVKDLIADGISECSFSVAWKILEPQEKTIEVKF